MTLFFQPDDIAVRARSNGRTVFEQIRAEHKRRLIALDLSRTAQDQRKRDRIARQKQPSAEENERRERFRLSWARMVTLATQEATGRDLLLVTNGNRTGIVRIKDILAETARKTGFTVQEIKGESRERKLVRVRQYVCWRAYNETSRSYPEIGRELGDRDHSTILHGLRKFQSALDRREPWAVMLAGAGE